MKSVRPSETSRALSWSGTDWAKAAAYLMLAFGVLATTAPSARACSPAPDTSYDDISKPDTLIVVATVTSFERSVGAGRICYHLFYDIHEVLYGKYQGPLEVLSCFAASSQEITDFSTEREETESEFLGFAEGANVLAALTTSAPLKGMDILPQQPGSYRFSVPTCWGPVHSNLGQVSEQERSKFIDEFVASLRPDQ